jgi:V/A-type H+-transporting ATPase subunit E
MEVQLQEIIDKIKNEGIVEAEKKASLIVADAETEASSIIAQARKEAHAIIEEAKAESVKFEAAGKQSISQGARDIILNLRTAIVRVLDSVVKRDVMATLSPDQVAAIVAKVVTAWADKGETEFDVLLSAKDIDSVREHFISQLGEKFRKGIELRIDPRLESGFRITEKNGSAFYDFSDEGLAAVLSGFVNPAVKECIDRALDAGRGA